MKKSILLMPLLLTTIMIGCSNGSSENSTIKTFTDINITSKTSESQTNPPSSANNEGNTTKLNMNILIILKRWKWII